MIARLVDEHLVAGCCVGYLNIHLNTNLNQCRRTQYLHGVELHVHHRCLWRKKKAIMDFLFVQR